MSLQQDEASNTTDGNQGCQSGGCHPAEVFPPEAMYVILCAGCIVVILNIPVVVTVLFTKVKSSNFVYLHILSLGLTDACVGLAVMFAATVKLLSEDQNNYWFCLARLICLGAVLNCSSCQVCVISFDRFLLFRSTAWQSITKNLSLLIKIVLSTLLFAVMAIAIPFFALKTSNFSGQCSLPVLFKDNLSIFLTYVGILSTFLIVFNAVCTCSNIGILWRHQKRRQRMKTAKGASRVNKEVRGIITLGMITSFHIVTTGPFSFYSLIVGLSGENFTPVYYLLTMALGCLSSAINPVIYSFRIPEMREGLKFIRVKVCR